MHRTTDRFWACFARIPEPIQKVARENFELLKANRNHPSLHFKKVWQAMVCQSRLNYRALAVEDGLGKGRAWGGRVEYELHLGLDRSS